MTEASGSTGTVLATRVVEKVRRSGRSRAKSARLGTRAATEGARGLFGLVRLPQPMGAGGQQPLMSRLGADITLRQPEQAEAFTDNLRVIRR